MVIVVSGSSGLIGQALCQKLETRGHEVRRLVRSSTERRGSYRWAPTEGELDSAALRGADAVIHLAGAGIADERWTPRRKEILRNSRLEGTRLIAERLAAGLSHGEDMPRVLLSASAVGYYGSTGEKILDETSSAGDDFLADLCREWEASTEAAEAAGVRVAHLRTGLVLSGEGGALAKMRLPFSLGLGGRLGSGKQYTSWIHIEDHVRAMVHLLENHNLSGPFNLVAPSPCTNLAFTRALGAAMKRPTIAPVPSFALKLALGEMGPALLLASQRALPKRLQESGFQFDYPDLNDALTSLL